MYVLLFRSKKHRKVVDLDYIQHNAVQQDEVAAEALETRKQEDMRLAARVEAVRVEAVRVQAAIRHRENGGC